MAGGKRAGAGRPKGVPNKINGDIKQMLLDALNAKGGAAYFMEQAEQNPAAFMTLVGKILPMQISGGEGTSGKLSIKWES